MTLPGGYNWFDAVLAAIVIVSIVIGYAQGLVRQIIMMLTLYVATVLAAQYYTNVSDFLRHFSPQMGASRLLNAFSFFLIWFVIVVGVNLLSRDTFKNTRFKDFPLIDQIGGAILGLVIIVLIIAIALPILAFTTGETWPGNEPTRELIVSGLDTSQLLPIFDYLRPALVGALGPWLPAGLPAIFSPENLRP